MNLIYRRCMFKMWWVCLYIGILNLIISSHSLMNPNSTRQGCRMHHGWRHAFLNLLFLCLLWGFCWWSTTGVQTWDLERGLWKMWWEPEYLNTLDVRKWYKSHSTIGRGAKCCPEEEGSSTYSCYCPEYLTGDPYQECYSELSSFSSSQSSGWWGKWIEKFKNGQNESFNVFVFLLITSNKCNSRLGLICFRQSTELFIPSVAKFWRWCVGEFP